MTRILFVTSYTGLGGGETALLSMMTSLQPRGLVPVLLVPRDGQLPQAARAHGIPVHVVPFRGVSTYFIPSVWMELPDARRLRTAIAAIAPDVVHSDYHSLPFAASACRRLGTPLIFMCWGWWFRPKWWQRSFFRTAPSLVIAGSRAIRDGFVGSPPFVSEQQVPVLYAGVDTARFRPRPESRDRTRQELGIPLDAPVVTMAARFQDVKGHDTFLEAAAIVGSRVPEARFVIAGESIFGVGAEDAFKQRVLRRHADDPTLRERVRFLGWVAEPERLLASSDLLVCASHFETYGMALLEAMSCGVPVVSTNVGGPAEIVLDGTTGFLVPPKQPRPLAERVIDLLENPARRHAMGAAARARVLESFTLEHYTAEFLRLATMACRGDAQPDPSAVR